MPNPDKTNVTSDADLQAIQPSATPYEKSFIASLDRYLNIPSEDIKTLWNPDTCPASHLPWLAWTFGVDFWDPNWPEATKRSVIKAAPEVHRKKGTVYALKKAIDALNYGAQVTEWFQYSGEPYRFRVSIDAPLNEEFHTDTARALYRTAIASKNVRSYLDSVRVNRPPVTGAVYVGGVTRSHIRISNHLDDVTDLTFPQPRVYVGGAPYTRSRMRFGGTNA